MLLSSLFKLKELFTNNINLNTDTKINSFKFDSRLVEQGDIFIALKDERDGHDFIDSAIAKGAIACIVDHKDESKNITQFIVNDTWEALNDIANYNRAHFNGKVIAITGSCGKTTNKQMLLDSLDNTYATAGNFNGLLGLPITLAHLNENAKSAVLELGTDDFGNILKLTTMAKPDIAVVTSIGPAHLEFFKTMDNIISEKLSIARGLNDNGCLIIPHDLYHIASQVTDKKILSVSIDDITSTSFIKSINNGLVTASINNNDVTFVLKDTASHKLINSLIYLTIHSILGNDVSEMALKLELFESPEGRGQILNLENGITIIDESYNANPLSMKKSFESFDNYKHDNKIAILGDMLELGNDEILLHKQIANYIKNVNIVYTVGSIMLHLHEELTNKDIKAKHFNSADDLLEFIKENAFANCAILIKGSNGSNVKKAVKLFKEGNK